MNRKAKGRADVNAPDDNNANKSCVLGLFRVAFARSSALFGFLRLRVLKKFDS